MNKTSLLLRNKQKGFALILIVVLIALAVGGYLLYQKQSKPVVAPQPPVQSSPTPSVSADETASWKTYTHSKYGYMFKYPADLIVKPFDYRGSAESSSIVSVGRLDNSGNVITFNSRSYQKKTSLKDAIRDVFVSEPNKEGTDILVDNHLAFSTSSEAEIDIKGKYKSYYLIIQQDEYNYKILISNYIFSNKNEKDKIIFNQILSTFKFTQ